MDSPKDLCTSLRPDLHTNHLQDLCTSLRPDPCIIRRLVPCIDHHQDLYIDLLLDLYIGLLLGHCTFLLLAPYSIRHQVPYIILPQDLCIAHHPVQYTDLLATAPYSFLLAVTSVISKPRPNIALDTYTIGWI